MISKKQVQESVTLVVLDLDLTITECILDEASFLGMDCQTKQAQYLKGYTGQESWVNLINSALTLYPPTLEKIEKFLKNVPLVQGMVDVIQYFKSIKSVQLVLITGSNSFLAEKYLQIHHLKDCFNKICANPCHFDSERNIFSYNNILQKCALPSCKPSTCKAFHLAQMLLKKSYHQVLYIGDGMNDLCGMSLLSQGIVFIRKNKELHKKILAELDQNCTPLEDQLKVRVIFWETGKDLGRQIRTLF